MEYGHFQHPDTASYPCYRKCIANEINSLYGGFPIYISRAAGANNSTAFGIGTQFINEVVGPFAVLVKTDEVSGSDVLSELLLCNDYGILDRRKVVTGNYSSGHIYNNIVFGGIAYNFTALTYDQYNTPLTGAMTIVVSFFCTNSNQDDLNTSLKIFKYTCTASTSGVISANPMHPYAVASVSNIVTSDGSAATYTLAELTPQIYTWMLDDDRMGLRCSRAGGGSFAVGVRGISGAQSVATEYTSRTTTAPEVCLLSCIEPVTTVPGQPVSNLIHNGMLRLTSSNNRYYIYDDRSNISTGSTAIPFIPLSAFAGSGSYTDTTYQVLSTRLDGNFISDDSLMPMKFVTAAMCFNGSEVWTYSADITIGNSPLNCFVFRNNNGTHQFAHSGISLEYRSSSGTMSKYFNRTLADPFTNAYAGDFNDCDPYTYGMILDGGPYGTDVYCMWTYDLSKKYLVCKPLVTNS